MATPTAHIEVVNKSINTVFANADDFDVVMYTDTSNQSIHFGTSNNLNALLAVTQSNVRVQCKISVAKTGSVNPSNLVAVTPSNIPGIGITTGVLTVARGGTGTSNSTGGGSVVLSNSPVLMGTTNADNVAASQVSVDTLFTPDILASNWTFSNLTTSSFTANQFSVTNWSVNNINVGRVSVSNLTSTTINTSNLYSSNLTITNSASGTYANFSNIMSVSNLTVNGTLSVNGYMTQSLPVYLHMWGTPTYYNSNGGVLGSGTRVGAEQFVVFASSPSSNINWTPSYTSNYKLNIPYNGLYFCRLCLAANGTGQITYPFILKNPTTNPTTDLSNADCVIAIAEGASNIGTITVSGTAYLTTSDVIAMGWYHAGGTTTFSVLNRSSMNVALIQRAA